MIMVQAMAAWRTGTTVVRSLEVIDCLLEALLFDVPGGALRQRRQSGRDVIGPPMMPCTARSIRIVTEQNEAAGLPRRVAPLQWRSNGGERFSPSQVKRRGIAAPSEKAVELSSMAFLPTPQAHKRLLFLRPKWIDPGQRSPEAIEGSCLQPRLRQLLNFRPLAGS
jgi:hypothetical protein